jgi:hypothetical protein
VERSVGSRECKAGVAIPAGAVGTIGTVGDRDFLDGHLPTTGAELALVRELHRDADGPEIRGDPAERRAQRPGRRRPDLRPPGRLVSDPAQRVEELRDRP